jgi:putative methyltransferase (TIGR04325 family)
MINLKKVAVLSLARTNLGRILRHVPFSQRVYKSFILSRHKYPALFYGIYDTYDEAWADIPKSRLRGWDHPEAASIWIDHVDPVRPSTYPVYFWISRVLRESSTLIDYGGSIGLTYYGYCHRAPLPCGARWIVVELPELVVQGRRTATLQNAQNLLFETELASIPQAEILLSAGALQFMSESVPGLLERLVVRPRHIILNKLPLTEGTAYWTLHNFGPAVTPYHVYNEREFINYFERHGYTIRDRWVNNDMSCDIPFHPERAVPEFAGLYLEDTA